MLTHFLSFVYLLKSYHQLNHHHPPSCIYLYYADYYQKWLLYISDYNCHHWHNHTALHCRKSDTDKSYKYISATSLQTQKKCHDMLKNALLCSWWWHVRRKMKFAYLLWRIAHKTIFALYHYHYYTSLLIFYLFTWWCVGWWLTSEALRRKNKNSDLCR